jgi:hypothetical protein
MGRRRVCRCHQRPSLPHQSDRHSRSRVSAPHRLPYREGSRQAHGHGSTGQTKPVRPGHSTDEWIPRLDARGGVRVTPALIAARFAAYRPKLGASRPGQAQERSVLWSSFRALAGQRGLTLFGSEPCSRPCRRSKNAPRRTSAAPILPTGAHGKGRIFMKSICNNCKNGLQGPNFGPLQGGLLHQDHTWAAMRQRSLHLVASAKISA